VTAPVVRVPDGGERTASDAWRAVRTARAAFWREAFARFRFGDGFSHSRALALQLSLAFIPLVIATVGLSGALATRELGQVLRLTLLELTPGGSNAVIQATLERDERAGLALWFGLVFALDLPTAHKYGRALLLVFLGGLPAMAGSGVLLAGAQFGEAVESVYGWDDDGVTAVAVPLGVGLVVFGLLAMLRLAPRRRQPGWLWLLLGAGLAATLWFAFTGLLVAYVQLSGSFGVVYGPLTGVIALLLWTQVTAIAILLGLAVTAQLEATHLGLPHGAVPDPEAPDRVGTPASA
jgi:uncharacterized BrkB/YihY/UPF0761 family membrane protein